MTAAAARARRRRRLALALVLVLVLSAGIGPLPAPDPVEPSTTGEELDSNTAFTSLDPMAMAVQDVLRGRTAILKVLPKLDRAIVPALETAFLASLSVDEDQALLLTGRLGDDRYGVREQATLTLIEVKAEIDPSLRKLQETARDPEVLWRLETILAERRKKPLHDDSLLTQALQIVYAHWFDELLAERAARLLNDPLDEPAALFFAFAGGDKIAAGIANRPPLEQARLWLGTVRMLGQDGRAIRALGQIDPPVLLQAARQSGWPRELPQPDTAGETVLYQAIDGNVLINALFIPHHEKRLYVVSQGFCIFHLPFGPGNPRPQTGAILRGCTQFRTDSGQMQSYSHRRMFYGLPPGMLLPRFAFVAGLDEDWKASLVRMPLWSKPFVPAAALIPTMKFVLNRGHDLPEPHAADRNLTPAISRAKLRKHTADWLAQPVPPRPADTAAEPAAADWQAFNNAAADQLPAVLTRLAATGQTAWVEPFAELAGSNRNGAGAAALAALANLDPARAGQLALRLTRVQWREDRARYALDFLKARFAQTPLERAWDFDHRLEPPADLLKRIPH